MLMFFSLVGGHGGRGRQSLRCRALGRHAHGSAPPAHLHVLGNNVPFVLLRRIEQRAAADVGVGNERFALLVKILPLGSEILVDLVVGGALAGIQKRLDLLVPLLLQVAAALGKFLHLLARVAPNLVHLFLLFGAQPKLVDDPRPRPAAVAARRARLYSLKRSLHPTQYHAGAERQHGHDQNKNGFPAHHISTNYGESSPRLESSAKYHAAAGVLAAPEGESDVSATSTPTHGGAAGIGLWTV